jgi:hypothetical protein
LSWSEYGKYDIVENKLILEYYTFSVYPETMNIRDSISTLEKPSQTRTFEIDNKLIYPLTGHGKRIVKMKDPYFRRKWSWILGNRYEYKILRSE